MYKKTSKLINFGHEDAQFYQCTNQDGSSPVNAIFGVLMWSSSVLTFAFTLGCFDSNDLTNHEKGSTDSSQEDDKLDSSSVDVFKVAPVCNSKNTCVALVHPEDCIADFQYGTTQGGSYPTRYDNFIGFYGVSDYSKDGDELVPALNTRDSEPAWEVPGCDTEKGTNYALRLKGEGFNNWGAGVGLDWGSDGELNSDCLYEDDKSTLSQENDCLEMVEQNYNILLSDLEADPRCQDENGLPDPRKMRCAMYGRTIKKPRDLSAYKGIGFWIMRSDPTSIDQINVKFSIPETTRWYGNVEIPESYRLDGRTYEEGYCSEDDGEGSTDCYNDFAYLLQLPEANGMWEYVEVLFENMQITPHWGLQLDYDEFPSERSIGLKLFLDMSPGLRFDFFFDDFHLIRK